jgi:hypothetical protein
VTIRNIAVTPGSGDNVSFDDNVQRVKMTWGATSTQTDVSATNPLPISGPLTDTQLRATAVPVSGTVTATGPLTDTQLRATAVPVSGPLTDTQLRAAAVPVSGTVTATGPLTDTQLRAAAVSVSGTVALGAGGASIGKLAANSGVDIGDVDVLTLPALVAGSAIIGKVGIDQTTDGTTNKVQAHINVAGAAQTAANPAPVSSPGFTSSASQTRPNDTTAYAALDVVGTNAATNMEFTGIGSVAGGCVAINEASLRIDVGSKPAGMDGFRLHLFNAAPTAIVDNAAFNLIAADRAKYLGYIDIGSPLDLGDTLYGAYNGGGNRVFKLAAASTTLYGVLQTITAFTPTAQTVKTVSISGFQV